MTEKQGRRVVELLVLMYVLILVLWIVFSLAARSHWDEESRFYDRVEHQEDQRLNLAYAQCEREVRRSENPGLTCGTIGHEQGTRP